MRPTTPKQRRRIRIELAFLASLLLFGGFDAYLRSREALPTDFYLRNLGYNLTCYDTSISFHPTESGYFVANDFHATAVNFEGGYRRTTDQPSRYRNTIYLFGNSTMAGRCITDAETIPSVLQRSLPDYKVLNRGMAGDLVKLHLARLQDETLNPGDIVIYYDGIGEPLLDFTRQEFACEDPILRNIGCVDRRDIPYPRIKEFQEGIAQARAYVMSHGAQFYVFLQPVIWVGAQNAYTQTVAAHVHPDESYIVSGAYALMRQTPGIIDLSRIFDNQSVFIDPLHISARGNAVIAQAIFEHLKFEF